MTFWEKQIMVAARLRKEGLRYPWVSFGAIMPWTRYRIPVFLHVNWARNDNKRRRA